MGLGNVDRDVSNDHRNGSAGADRGRAISGSRGHQSSRDRSRAEFHEMTARRMKNFAGYAGIFIVFAAFVFANAYFMSPGPPAAPRDPQSVPVDTGAKTPGEPRLTP